MSADDVDEYLAQLDEPKRSTLEQVRRSIATAIPEAEQGLSYGVPVFRIGGKPVAGFSAAKNWLSYLPHSGDILSAMSDEDLCGFAASKGALKFPIDQPLPDALVRRLIDARRAQAGV
ncbi:MAG: DUF1801 domain-containing protein [Acidimicrobiales bacterium]